MIELTQKLSQKLIKKQLIKIINKTPIDDLLFEPRYIEENYMDYGKRVVIGSIITIRTSESNGGRNEKKK